ncbi:P-loop containing nucleoside triphosphate hydrolase protein [Lipomyces orientalis]|uniref:P-loop containing nucleoside triphosphate hydrolase protein n=1 Tax=Lipomyces orientalis TaxID=1233043 RepID=A0ACC3TEQ2_9ASCO
MGNEGHSVSRRKSEFAGPCDRDAQILHEQIHIPTATASFFRLFRYANSEDKAILFLGFCASVMDGLMKPLMAIVFGAATMEFTDMSNNNFDSNQFIRNISRLALYLVFIGVASSLFTFVKTYLFRNRAEILSARIREQYLAATLRQNIGYFDTLGPGEITSRIASDTVAVQDAMSEKISYLISHTTTILAATVVAYIRAPLLSLIVTGNVFVIIFVSYLGSRVITKYSELAQTANSLGGTLAEESISSISNVQAFGIQHHMVQAYDKLLKISEKWSIRAGYAGSLQSGITFLFAFSIDALAYWQGTRLLTEGKVNVSAMMTVILTLIYGAYAFMILAPYITTISNGLAASTKIFATIDRKSAIDSFSRKGKRLAEVNGDIELRSVRFIYPSRPHVPILRDFSLHIPAGQTVALVGESGSGKSTIISLLERFYNPVDGQILLDGHDIFDLNTRWLRQTMALVSQQSELFSCSIFDNICCGLIGTTYENASTITKREKVIEACKQANAWDFIQTLPSGLETLVGERGILLSGGQRQRIAIARAIVGNPKILLLDEATSALDTKSEATVQEALDRAAKNRTTIVIAHRLSTIKNADLIVVMHRGEILEKGTHDELMTKMDRYYRLIQSQSIEARRQFHSESENLPACEEVLREKNVIDVRNDSMLMKTSGGDQESIGTFHGRIEDKKLPSIWAVMKLLYKIGQTDIIVMVIGLVSSVITGFGYVGLGILYGVALQRLEDYGTPYHYQELKKAVYPTAGFLFMVGVILLFTSSIGGCMFSYSSSNLVRHIRALSFQHILRQDISYFDAEEHSAGALCSALANEAQSIESLGGVTMNKLLECITIFLGGFVVSVVIGFKLGLVMFGTVPIIVIVGALRFRSLAMVAQNKHNDNEISSAQACEATSAIRTVLSLTREEKILEQYGTNLKSIIEGNRAAEFRSAVFEGLAEGMQYFITALGFWYGSILVARGEYSLFQFFAVFLIVVFGADHTSTFFTFAPEMGKALNAGRNIKKLLDSVPDIDSWNSDGNKIHEDQVEGEIELHDIFFRYPSRPNIPVLQGLSLTVKKGQFVALVGSSGCGKSTIIGLIELFYRPQCGSIFLDGHDIQSLSVSAYRGNFALVQQEPTLYTGTIKYNVALGCTRQVSEEEIVMACRQANIHDFVMSLPDGYDTLCGAKGVLLSGGQKQRIAIARAVIRQPKVLLLDEATSALDSESETVVQAALNEAAKGRTTIAIAHRLSTIRNADMIYVIDKGSVLESGTHRQLLANQGKYFELVQLQSLETD